MKAFILDRYGRADRVRAGDMPDPELPREGHEVVSVDRDEQKANVIR